VPMVAFTRDQLRLISGMRLKESKILLDSGNYSGAYYLCGYAIECGLKACIAKEYKKYIFPDKKFVASCYTHDLVALVNLAGLKNRLKEEQGRYPEFAKNWTNVKDWDSESRYRELDEIQAKNLYRSVSGQHGVLKWVKKNW
jgi:hypothetical protein